MFLLLCVNLDFRLQRKLTIEKLLQKKRRKFRFLGDFVLHLCIGRRASLCPASRSRRTGGKDLQQGHNSRGNAENCTTTSKLTKSKQWSYNSFKLQVSNFHVLTDDMDSGGERLGGQMFGRRKRVLSVFLLIYILWHSWASLLLKVTSIKR